MSVEYKHTRWAAIKRRIAYDATTWLGGRAGERVFFLLGGL